MQLFQEVTQGGSHSPMCVSTPYTCVITWGLGTRSYYCAGCYPEAVETPTEEDALSCPV